jgi:uncharacterized protein (DUF2345 family)
MNDALLDAMTAPLAKSMDIEQVLALLATAQSHILADRLADAAQTYLTVLAEPALDAHLAARSEVQANYGALLLHQVHLDADGEDAGRRLDEAIDMLLQARAGYGLVAGDGLRVTNDANLALAYFLRHRRSGQHKDLMAAHLALDGAEARIDRNDNSQRDWIRSIRDTLVDHTDRRRKPRLFPQDP